MRIAQLASLAESVPPSLYGGTERVISWITEELVNQGHSVTLFASGDSITSANLAAIPGCSKALRLQYQNDDAGFQKAVAKSNKVLLEMVVKREDEFDMIHCHSDIYQWPALEEGLGKRIRSKVLTTMHGRLGMSLLTPIIVNILMWFRF